MVVRYHYNFFDIHTVHLHSNNKKCLFVNDWLKCLEGVLQRKMLRTRTVLEFGKAAICRV